MTKPQRRPRKTQKQWKAIMDDFERSPLSSKAYCDDKDLAYGTFSKWRRRLAKPGIPKQASPLVELTLPAQAIQSASDNWQVELALGNGMTLRLRTV